MTYDTFFVYAQHFLQTVVGFLSCPTGIVFLGMIISLIIVSIFNSIRH